MLPTDTLYGLVGSALVPAAVRRIYRVRKRETGKPLIVLIASLRDLARFGVSLTPGQKKFARAVWPGRVSIILPCRFQKYKYLHRGKGSLAFRMPAPEKLHALLKKTGPLVAPSANVSGHPPARTLAEAKRYFGTAVDFYVSGGKKSGRASTLVGLMHARPAVVRMGAVKIPKKFLK